MVYTSSRACTTGKDEIVADAGNDLRVVLPASARYGMADGTRDR